MDSFSSSKKRMLTLAVLCAVGGSLPVMAAPADGDVVRTKDVIVTATRTEEEVKVVPQAVEVITSEDIEKIGATDVYQALRLASNVDVGTAGMAGHNVMIRGMDTNHTLILINGIRQAGEDTAQTQNVYALNRLSLSDIERIEIVRGPSSAQYGSDALGGVINIITKKSAKSEPSIMAGVSTGTESVNNYYHIDFGQHDKFNGTLDMRFSKWRKNVRPDSEGSNYYGPVFDVHFDGNYDLGNNQNLNFSAGYYNERSQADYADSWTSSGAFQTKKDSKEWYNYKRYDYSLAWTGNNEKHDWMIRSFYSYLKKDNRQYNYRDTFPGPMETILGGLYPKYDWDHSEYSLWGVEGKDSIAINDNHTLTFGTEYRSTDVEGTRMGDGGDNVHQVSQTGNGYTNTKYYSEKDIQTYAAYIQDEWMIGDKLLVIPSLRFDHDSTFGGETTPKIGATYFINDHNRFKVSWGKGFKAPTISEMYMNMHRSMGGGIVNTIGNPDLQPEETESWDISYEFDNDKNWGKITYFQNDVKNLITSTPIPGLNDPDGGERWYQNVNVDRAQINGIELELGHNFNKYFTVKATSNWLDATDDSTGERLSNRAKNITTLQLSYDDLKPYGYTVMLWSQWVNKYRWTESMGYGDDANSIPHDATYNTVNFVVNKKFGKGNRIFAGVDNIFDKKNYDVFLDGRIWVAGAEWTF